MVLRPEALRERLLKLEEVISRLEQIAQRDPSSDFRDAWAGERGLQLGAEIIFDIGNHILSAHFGISANDYEDIIAQLGACAVIGDSLRDRLKGLGGFRNILVHDYMRLDPVRVADFRKRAPLDFSDFADAVRRWLSATTGSGSA